MVLVQLNFSMQQYAEELRSKLMSHAVGVLVNTQESSGPPDGHIWIRGLEALPAPGGCEAVVT